MSAVLRCSPRFARFGSFALLLAAVSACTPVEDVLPGDRQADLRDLDSVREQLAAEQDPYESVLRERPETRAELPPFSVTGDPAPLTLPKVRSVSDWEHRYLSTARAVPHLSFAETAPRQIWTTSIGAGNAMRQRVPSAPVAADGRIFAMDALHMLSAVDSAGAILWQQSLVPAGETPGEVTGGGLAVKGDTLFVTTGYGRLHALDVTSGATKWMQRFDAALTAPPLVDGSLVYVTTRDGFGFALDRELGRIVWATEGDPDTVSALNGGAASIAGNAVLFSFPSGQIQSLLKQGGISLWTGSVAGNRVGRASSRFNTIVGAPVVSGGSIYVTTATGRLAALDATTGARKWTTLEGGTGPVLPVGSALFAVSDESRLLRLDARTGALVWAATLPFFETDRIEKREDIHLHFGPILAGGRLILTSTDGLLREIDPVSGDLLRTVELGAGAVAEPILVDGVLYVLTEDGALRAFR